MLIVLITAPRCQMVVRGFLFLPKFTNKNLTNRAYYKDGYNHVYLFDREWDAAEIEKLEKEIVAANSEGFIEVTHLAEQAMRLVRDAHRLANMPERTGEERPLKWEL